MKITACDNLEYCPVMSENKICYLRLLVGFGSLPQIYPSDNFSTDKSSHKRSWYAYRLLAGRSVDYSNLIGAICTLQIVRHECRLHILMSF